MVDILFVVGVQRSATSTLAGATIPIAAARPSGTLSAEASVPKGCCEPEDVAKANDEILASEQRQWNDCRPVSLPQGGAREAIVADCARLLDNTFDEGSLRVLKDPRVSILAPLWIEAAEQTGARPCFVVMLQDPVGSAASLVRRDGISADSAVALWLRYMLDAERNSRGQARAIVRADAFVRDPVATLDGVGGDLDLSLPKAPDAARVALEGFVDSVSLNVPDDFESKYLDLARAVHTALADLARAPEREDLIAELDRLGSEFDTLCPDIHAAMVFDQFDKAVTRQRMLETNKEALVDATATAAKLQSQATDLTEQVTRLTDEYMRLTDEYARLTEEHGRVIEQAAAQSAAQEAVLTELVDARSRPIKTLGTFLKFNALKALSKASPPLPVQMTGRFAKSAAKRDPKRVRTTQAQLLLPGNSMVPPSGLAPGAARMFGRTYNGPGDLGVGATQRRGPLRTTGKIALRPGRPFVMLCSHSAEEKLYGGERSLLDMIDALNELDLNVIVTVPNSRNSTYFETLREKSLAVYVLRYGWWRSGVPVSESAVANFSRIIADEGIELVHVNTIVIREPLIAAQRMGVRSIIHVRELIRHDDALREMIGLPAENIINQIWDSCDRLIVNSDATLRDFASHGREPLLVNNTVDLEPLAELPVLPDHTALRVGLISSNIPKKGIWDFTRIAQDLALTHPEISFHLIGAENQHTAEISEQIASGKLPASLKVLGYRETPVEAVVETDIILNLSHFQESFGRTVLEGMAASRPVIVYDHGAPSEIVSHEETGIVVPPGDTDAVAAEIRSLAADRSRMLHMGQRAREDVTSRFGAAIYKEQMRRAFDGFIGVDPPKPRKLKLPARADLSAQPRSALKIAYFIWHFPVPSETFVLNELRLLREQGIDVRVFCRNSPHPDFEPDFDISWERVAEPDDLARRLVETGRTIVHAHFVYPTVTEMVWPACEQAEVPFTFIAHSQDIFRHLNDAANRIDEISQSKWCRKVFVPSRFHRQYLAARNVPEGKMMINPNGCDHRLYADGWVADRKKRPFRRIVAIHRFTEKKGLVHLIRAGKLLEEDDVRIEIYGYGDLEGDYREAIAKESITNVELCGPVDGREAMLELFRESDLFACPSVQATDGDMDGIPTVLMEAMAAGLPVLSTDLSGIPDLVEDGITGLVCDPTPESIAKRIQAYYRLPDAAVAAMIETASERIRSDYNSEHLVENLLRVWAGERIDLMIVSWNNLAQMSEVIRRLYKYTSLPFHLIICDNGSDTPALAQLMEIYGAHENVTIVLNRENAFVGPGTNICLAEGQSDYAIYLCGKEGMTTFYGWEKSFVTYMNTHPRIGQAGTLCYSPSYLFGRDYPEAQALWDKFRNPDFALNNPDRRFSHVQGGLFVLRREMLDEIGGFSEDVPHNSTDVEFSYYVESCGWELGEVPGMMSLFNKTRPGLFHRIDERMWALHPPALEDLRILDAIARQEVYHCNVCGRQSEAFADIDEAAECPRCGAGRNARSLHRVLAESTLLYRRLPALGVNVPPAIDVFWREQFQGHAYSAGELAQKLAENGLDDIADGRLQLVMLNAVVGAEGAEDNRLLSESARVLAPGGTLIIAGTEETVEGLTPRLEPLGLSYAGSKRYASSVSHYDWLPVMLYNRMASAA